MALSEQEQRHLDDLEARLTLDDPRLAHVLSTGMLPPSPRAHGGSLAAVGVVVGLSLLVGGLRLHPVVSLVGFLLMLASLVAGLRPPRPTDRELWSVRASHPAGQGLRSRNLDREQHPGTF